MEKSALVAATGWLCVALAGCFSGEDLFHTSEVEESSHVIFDGCIGGHGVDETRVYLMIDPPSKATRMHIYRDGVLVGVIPGTATSYVDTGLAEGATYKYTCEAIVRTLPWRGTEEVQLSTITTQAPTFSGITSAVAQGGSTIQVNWAAATGSIPTASYRIYANMGTVVDWTRPPRMTVGPSVTSALVTGVADEIRYAVGVRACAVGPMCDTNMVEKTLTMPDGGAPTSGAITGLLQIDGEVRLTVPWAEANGGLYKRRVYIRQGAAGGTVLGNYTFHHDENISDITNPKTLIPVTGLLEGTQYHFLVLDQDLAGQNSTNLTPVTITTTDLTRPVFTGPSSVALGADVEHSIRVNFTAINSEAVSPSAGAKEYVVFMTSAVFPSAPADSCTLGTETAVKSATGLTAGTATFIDLTGLNNRTSYGICLKARDSANNHSSNLIQSVVTTRDITAPDFDGIQTLTFDAVTTSFNMTWNPSLSPDVETYQIKLWKNVASPDPMDITTLYENASAAQFGKSYTSSDYAFAQDDVVYVLVNACDDASSIPGGTDNCSGFTTTAALNVDIPDYTPPPGFGGISPAVSFTTPAEGQVLVKWAAPADWTDYRGFKVYDVIQPGNTLQAIKDCRCTSDQASCTSPSPYTQCLVTGLNAYRTYRFHVRAYDAAGNETQLDPTISYADKRTTDQTAPIFVSGLALGAGPAYPMSWTAASDNQYVLEPGAVISYEIYRKEFTTFASAVNPLLDGPALAVLPAGVTTYTDTTRLQSTTYFYTACALDASSNRTCDGIVRSVTTGDTESPKVLTFTSTADGKKRRWNLSWTLSDNVTASGSLWVRLFQRTGSNTEIVTNADTLITEGPGLTGATNLTGPVDTSTNVFYYLEVEDQAGNLGFSRHWVASDSRLTLTGIARTGGPVSGGKIVVLKGTGFRKPTENGYGTAPTVTIGGVPCGSVTVYDSYRMSCVTGVMSSGVKNVVVTSADGSSATLPSAYTAMSPSTFTCDNPGGWGADFAAGIGTVGNPFVICTPAQLDRLRLAAGQSGALFNYRTGGFYFKLGDNIDLQSSGVMPIPDVGLYFVGGLEGDGNAILNFTYSNAAETGVGLFRTATLAASNLDLLNFDVTGGQRTGALAGQRQNQITVSNIHAVAKVRGTQRTGGLVGYHEGATIVVQSCHGTFDVGGTTVYTGGLIASGDVRISDSWTEGVLTSTGNYAGGVVGAGLAGSVVTNVSSKMSMSGATSYQGGIVGVFQGTSISNVSFGGSIVSGNPNAGGIVGYLDVGATLQDADFTGSVTGTSYPAGIAGYMQFASATRVYSRGVVSGTSEVGGVIGRMLCSNLADAAGTGIVDASVNYVGGVVGRWEQNTNVSCPATAYILRSYSRGLVRAPSFVGAFAAVVYFPNAITDLEIQDSFSTAHVVGKTSGGSFVGLLQLGSTKVAKFIRSYFAGRIDSASGRSGMVENCTACTTATITAPGHLWDLDRTGTTLVGTGAGLPAITGKTNAQMLSQAPGNVYETAGFSFPSTFHWPASSNENGGYPVVDTRLSGPSTRVFLGVHRAVEITGSSAKLEWFSSPHATSYMVENMTSGSPVFVAAVAAGTTSYLLTGLSPSTSYTYRVRMVDIDGRESSVVPNVTFMTSNMLCYPSEVLRDVPTVYLRFNEASGPIFRNLGSAVNVTATANGGYTAGQTSPVTSDAGKALLFNGTTGYVDLGNSSELDITGNQTVEMWVKPTALGTIMNPWAKAYGGSGALTVNTTGTLQYLFGTSGVDSAPNTSLTSTQSVVAGSWVHVAFVRNVTGNTLTLYINGTLAATGAAGGYPSAGVGTANMFLGKGYAGFFNGAIDEFAVYPSALSAARVRSHYSAATSCSTAPLTDVKTIPDLKLWLAASSLAGTPDGTLIGNWPDLSGLGNHATQATPANQATFKTNIVNGQPVMRFVAGKRYTLPNITQLPSSTVYVVYDPTDAMTGYKILLDRSQTNNGPAVYISGTGGNMRPLVYWGPATIQTTFWPVANSAWGMFAWQMEPNYITETLNGSSQVFVNVKSNFDAWTTISTAFAGQEYSGDIAELIIFNRALNGFERDQIEKYLKTKYNLP